MWSAALYRYAKGCLPGRGLTPKIYIWYRAFRTIRKYSTFTILTLRLKIINGHYSSTKWGSFLLYYYRNCLALYKFIFRWMSRLIMSKYIYLFNTSTDATDKYFKNTLKITKITMASKDQ